MKVAVIPARFDSSRFPGKPLALIAGKPMVIRVWEQAIKIPGVDLVAVATDDGLIANAVRDAGGIAWMTGEHQSGTDRIAEACSLMPADAIVLNVQGDLPFFRPEVGAELIRALESDPGADIATPVIAVKDDIVPTSKNAVKAVFGSSGNALYFSRAVIPFVREITDGPLWYRHIGVYCYRNSALQRFAKLPQSRLEKIECLEQLRALENGMKIKCVVVDKDCGPEINCPNDLKRLQEEQNGIAAC